MLFIITLNSQYISPNFLTAQVPEACCVRVGGEALDCTGAPTPGSAYLEGCYALLAPSAVPALTLSLVVVSLFQVQAQHQQGDTKIS
jgi:hypothetical protein